MSQRPSILLLDEDADILEQLQTVLQREGYQVFVAVDGHAALRLATMATPDLIVSDIFLAELDGYEVWRQLRRNKETASIPILVTSALTIPPSNQTWRPTPGAEWQLLQYDAALPKPIDLARFVRVVKKLLTPAESNTIPGGPSVIVAGQDQTVQNEMSVLLQKHDYGIRTPDTLGKTLQLTKSMPPAALILDYHQPNESLRDIIWQAGDFAPNTVVLLIINPDQQIEPEIQTYCDGYLTLPFHPLATLNILEQAMEIHSMQRRTEVLSTQLLTANQRLLDTQQTMHAQNQELRHNLDNASPQTDHRGAFTGMVVHDLRSPLGSILGTLNFIATDPDLNISPILDNLIAGSMTAGGQMLRLIETIMEGQRLESGDFEAYDEPFDAATIISLVIEQITPFLELHQLRLEQHLSPTLPLAYADVGATQRIIENLFDNAIKYAPSQTAIILQAEVEDNYIKVSLTDQGPGIPPEQLPYVFDRMMLTQKVGSAAARPGFGLGLTYCGLAAAAIRGTISVKSDSETGATFAFTIPLFDG